MEKSNELMLYHNILVLRDNKLLFYNQVIYDFRDRYQNISAVGVEQQLQIFHQLIKVIYDTNIQNEEKAQGTIILASLFRILSTKNTSSSLLGIGENIFIQLFIELIKVYGKENRFFELNSNKNYQNNGSKNVVTVYVDNYNNINYFSENYFSVIFINHDSIKNNFEKILKQCYSLIEKDGTIVLFGKGKFDTNLCDDEVVRSINLYELGMERFIAVVNIDKFGTTKENKKDQVLYSIEVLNSELFIKLQYLLTNYPISKDHDWYKKIDESIYIMAKIESIVASNFSVFDNKDLKFYTNEVKNALLDFKYEAYLGRDYYDFFQATLYDCYNTWVENII